MPNMDNHDSLLCHSLKSELFSLCLSPESRPYAQIMPWPLDSILSATVGKSRLIDSWEFRFKGTSYSSEQELGEKEDIPA